MDKHQFAYEMQQILDFNCHEKIEGIIIGNDINVGPVIHFKMMSGKIFKVTVEDETIEEFNKIRLNCI